MTWIPTRGFFLLQTKKSHFGCRTTKLLSQKRHHLEIFCTSFYWQKGTCPEKRTYYCFKKKPSNSIFIDRTGCYDFLWMITLKLELRSTQYLIVTLGHVFQLKKIVNSIKLLKVVPITPTALLHLSVLQPHTAAPLPCKIFYLSWVTIQKYNKFQEDIQNGHWNSSVGQESLKELILIAHFLQRIKKTFLPYRWVPMPTLNVVLQVILLFRLRSYMLLGIGMWIRLWLCTS